MRPGRAWPAKDLEGEGGLVPFLGQGRSLDGDLDTESGGQVEQMWLVLKEWSLECWQCGFFQCHS